MADVTASMKALSMSSSSGDQKERPSPVPAGEHITQYKIECDGLKDKMECLVDLLEAKKVFGQCMVFCTTRTSLMNLAKYVKNHEEMKYSLVLVLHGKLDKADRDQAVEDFRNFKYKIILCTDALARGFNLPEVSVVIHFDVAYNQDNHIHRMGSCGRIGADGKHQNGHTITLLENGKEVDKLRRIEDGLPKEMKSKSVDRSRSNLNAVFNIDYIDYLKEELKEKYAEFVKWFMKMKIKNGNIKYKEEYKKFLENLTLDYDELKIEDAKKFANGPV